MASKAGTWDVFISYASEDKSFTEELARRLKESGLRFWYDAFSLEVGDSLRWSINEGLAGAQYGITVISRNFLGKEWPQRELDGLFAREVDGKKVILPVWHGVGQADVARCSPMLADRLAVSSEHGVEHVVREILRAIDWAPARDLGSVEEDLATSFLTKLATALATVLIIAKELELIQAGYDVGLLRKQLFGLGAEVREIALYEAPAHSALGAQLLLLVDEINIAAEQAEHPMPGQTYWSELAGRVAIAGRRATRLRIEFIDPVPELARNRKDALEIISRLVRALEDLDMRSQRINSIKMLQKEASDIGYNLLHLSYCPIKDVEGKVIEDLMAVGHRLHLLETEEVFIDGGESARRIRGLVHDLAAHFRSILRSLAGEHTSGAG